MKTKCPFGCGCLDYIWIANRRFFSCFLCRKTYDIYQDKLREVKEIILVKDMNGNDSVEKVTYVE
jgi:hypothetical protein